MPMPVPTDAEPLAARLYDAFQPDCQPEVSQWLAWIGEKTGGSATAASFTPRDVLLAPARTGELAAALAQAGHRVKGLDSSSFFLREAVQRHWDETLTLQFRPAELSRLQLSSQFDFVAVPREGFSLLGGATAVRNALLGLGRSLRPGGALMAQMVLPPPAGTARGRWFQQADARPARPHLLPRGWQAVRTWERWWDGRQRDRWVNVFQVTAGQRVHEMRVIEERSLLTPADLADIFAEAGFGDVQVLTGAWPQTGNGEGRAPQSGDQLGGQLFHQQFTVVFGRKVGGDLG